MKNKLGNTSMPAKGSELRMKHMQVINKFGSRFVRSEFWQKMRQLK